MTVQVTINGRETEIEGGASIWEAARQIGIEIPALCHHPDLPPVGSCRLCLVNVDGWSAAVCACVTDVADGLTIETETSGLAEQRRQVLELLLADFTGDTDSDEFKRSEFGRWCRHYNVGRPTWGRKNDRFPVDRDPNPFIRVNFNECIMCTRCVRACDDVQGRFVWGVSERSRDTRIVAGADTTMLDARCESCGACAAYCPTGALTDRVLFGTPPPDRIVPTTCTYCGVGCQLGLNVRDERVVAVTSLPDVQPNGMSLCVKGRYGFDFVHHRDRLLRPRVREHLLEDRRRSVSEERGRWVEVEWETALDVTADRLFEIWRQSGGDSIGLLASAKCTNEENYLMQKLARQVFETHNIDHCARLCHASTVAGLSMCFGSGAMSNSMDDIVEHAQALFIIGSNTTEQHPVFGTQIRQCVLRRRIPLVVADPRRIDMTEFAALHLRQRPGTDVALLNGLMNLIIENDWHDRAFIESRCEDFDEFQETIATYNPERVAEITDVSVADLRRATEMLALNKPMAVIWAMGITQHITGVMNVLSLGNLQMLLGNMGVPGGGVNPLRGQNNVQGACDMGALPNVFTGYQSVMDAALRAKFGTAWALSRESQLPATPGLTVTEMIDWAGTGELRGLYILGENPVMTDPDSNHVRECLQRCEFFVLQEIFPSETSHYADVLLPGTTFAERSGTFSNTDRRIQRVRQAIAPLGESRPDWQIVSDLARRLLERQQRTPQGPCAAWNYGSPEEIMHEIAAVTPSYGGVTYPRLDRGERLQWPVTGEEHSGTPILHVGRFTRGRGKFHAVDHLPPHELPDEEYPLLLTTGRVLYHWHGGEMTRRSAGLHAVLSEALLEISPEDAARLGVSDGDPVFAQSRRGEMYATAVVTQRVPIGIVFGNFHFPGLRNVNNLTIAALDPIAKIPEYKVCAVRIAKHHAEPVDDASIGRSTGTTERQEAEQSASR